MHPCSRAGSGLEGQVPRGEVDVHPRRLHPQVAGELREAELVDDALLLELLNSDVCDPAVPQRVEGVPLEAQGEPRQDRNVSRVPDRERGGRPVLYALRSRPRRGGWTAGETGRRRDRWLDGRPDERPAGQGCHRGGDEGARRWRGPPRLLREAPGLGTPTFW